MTTNYSKKYNQHLKTDSIDLFKYINNSTGSKQKLKKFWLWNVDVRPEFKQY